MGATVGDRGSAMLAWNPASGFGTPLTVEFVKTSIFSAPATGNGNTGATPLLIPRLRPEKPDAGSAEKIQRPPVGDDIVVDLALLRLEDGRPPRHPAFRHHSLGARPLSCHE